MLRSPMQTESENRLAVRCGSRPCTSVNPMHKFN
jgi:hypothetical protein